MVVFSGEFKHTLDSKNRVFIPAKLREQLGENFMIMHNVQGCLDIITEEAVEALVALGYSKSEATQVSDMKIYSQTNA